MPAAGAPATLSALPDVDPVRDAPLSRVHLIAAAWAAQDAEFEAESAALAAAGGVIVPDEEELAGLVPDPASDPPDGVHGWLADLPGPLVDEYPAATTGTAGPDLRRAGLRGRAAGERAGFAADGPADLGPPGPVLAGLVARAHAAGLGRLTDDELAGVIRAGRRLSSWASAVELAAVGDLMRRREAQEAAGHTHAAEHADAEIAALLTMTGRGAGRLLDLATSLRRLPLTAQALAAGAIDLPRVAVIADETTGLDDDHAAAVERHILVRAPGQTTSQLRAAARRAVLTADPRAARRRQERARQEARVERWDEHAGTAALAGRDLPPAEVIAADEHISALARALRAGGLAGTTDQLRARAFLALLSGLPASSLLPTGPHQPHPAARDSGNPAGAGTSRGPSTPRDPSTPGDPGTPRSPDTSRDPSTPRGPGIPGDPSTPGGRDIPGDPSTPGGRGIPGDPSTPGGRDIPGDPSTPRDPGTPSDSGMTGDLADPGITSGPAMPGDLGVAADRGVPGDPSTPITPVGSVTPIPADWPGIPPVAGMVNLTMPWETWLGSLGSPGEVAGFGPLSADDSRLLGLAMAGHPQTRWCVTLTGADGRPVAHGCAGPAQPPRRTVQPAPAPPPPADGSALLAHAPGPPAQGSGPPADGSAPRAHGPGPPADGSAPLAHAPGPPAHGSAPRADGSAPRAHAPGPPAHGSAPRADGPGPPADGSAPRAHAPGPPADGSAPRADGPGPPGYGLRPPTRRPAPSGSGAAGTADADRQMGTFADRAGFADWLARLSMKWFESDDCGHQRQSAAYRPPPALRHLIGVRQQTCAFPGCRRPASQCDLDHTTPFHRGGPTCECNLAPLCRKHHEAKQAPGWRLEHLRPGVLAWITPSRRSYSTKPTVYPS